jgi:hypothetical protein
MPAFSSPYRNLDYSLVNALSRIQLTQNFYLGAQPGFPFQVLARCFPNVSAPSCGLFIAIPGAIRPRNAFLQILACPFTQCR